MQGGREMFNIVKGAGTRTSAEVEKLPKTSQHKEEIIGFARICRYTYARACTRTFVVPSPVHHLNAQP